MAKKRFNMNLTPYEDDTQRQLAISMPKSRGGGGEGEGGGEGGGRGGKVVSGRIQDLTKATGHVH